VYFLLGEGKLSIDKIGGRLFAGLIGGQDIFIFLASPVDKPTNPSDEQNEDDNVNQQLCFRSPGH